jgi:hypothetical protein
VRLEHMMVGDRVLSFIKTQIDVKRRVTSYKNCRITLFLRRQTSGTERVVGLTNSLAALKPPQSL